MQHLTEDDLVLHYYGEMGAALEQSASAHLSDCAACRAAFTRLQRVLSAIDESVLAPAVPDGFERTVWARLEPNLRRERRGWLGWLAVSPVPLAVGAAVLMLAVGAFFAGRFSSPRVDMPSTAGVTAEHMTERILLIDLGEHLDRSQMILVELASAEAGATLDITGERRHAEQLLAANRLYRQTAASTGDTAVSELLDELERVLVELAAGPGRLSPGELEAVRNQIEANGLLFRVRVATSEIRQRQKEALQQRTGQRTSVGL